MEQDGQFSQSHGERDTSVSCQTPEDVQASGKVIGEVTGQEHLGSSLAGPWAGRRK